jgi:hypothetical protein
MIKYFAVGVGVIVGAFIVAYGLGFLIAVLDFHCRPPLSNLYPCNYYGAHLAENVFDGFIALLFLMCLWLLCTTIGILVVHWRSISPEQLGRLLEKLAPKDS